MKQSKHLDRIAALYAHGLYAPAARSLSALLRASLTDAAAAPLIEFAAEHIGMIDHPDFIVSEKTRAKILARGSVFNEEALDDAYEERVRMSYHARGYHNIY